MNVRNVQKTGKMHYVYLPTEWCKKYSISSDTQLMVSQDQDGVLRISPKLVEKKPKDLELTAKEEDIEIIHKLIMACYINPLNSFRITLDKSMDSSRILQQKKLISLALIEASGNVITGESNLSIENPLALLQTMFKKTRNLLYLMTDTYDPELIKRYEEEIDNSKSFIEKAVIASFTFYKPSKLKAIETYYIALIARDLERFVDHLILLQKADSHLIKQTLEVIDHMKVMISSLNPDDPRAGFSHAECMKLIKKIIALGKIDIKDIDSYHRNRVKAQLFSISEVLMDWAITQEIAD